MAKIRQVDFQRLFYSIIRMLAPEKRYYGVAIIYGIGVSLLTLSVPVSVQMLINSISFIGIRSQVIVLALILFVLLLLSCGLYALQIYIMELFERRFFVRIVSDIVIQNLKAATVYLRSINRVELINRYFDIMTVQKNVPYMLTGGIALFFQTIVGLSMISFYHPAFLGFTIVLVITLYFVLRVLLFQIIRSGLSLSDSKYAVAKWIEEVTQTNCDFKSNTSILFALNRSSSVIERYLNVRKIYFSLTFWQVLCLLVVYALFSSLLLGLGGLLVIREELSLGQLVAAELILSTMLFNISRSGQYLQMFYEVAPAIDKLSSFYRLPSEPSGGRRLIQNKMFDIVFKQVVCEHRESSICFDFTIQTGQKLLAGSNSFTLQESFLDLISAYKFPEKGQVLIDQKDIAELNPYRLRDHIIVVNTPFLIEDTIESYVKISTENVSTVDIMQVLQIVELDQLVRMLPAGLQTNVVCTGHPFSRSETLRLKLANSLLRRPSVLILTEQFDVVSNRIRQRIMKYLSQQQDMTVIYFSNQLDIDCFEDYLYLDKDENTFFGTLKEFRKKTHPRSSSDRSSDEPV